ncbi:MAG: zinc ribbon domain-containing protein [Pseudomonadales bacterium]|jgi:putative FmdB family regulatory protein|nr:zinc ribbon domain-containing protein [Pseudomonadales bacterium]
MPIYDFQCKRCGHQFEKLVRVDQSAECPACQAASCEVVRLFSSPAISTQKSRSVSLAEAKGRSKAIKKEKDHAQAEYERNYIRDHS